MKLRAKSLFIHILILSAPIMSGCGMGGALGGVGNLASLVPSGARLTGSENDFFMDKMELTAANNPYRLAPSAAEAPPASRPVALYGIFEFKK